MTPLRQRMLEDLQIRNYSPTTILIYLHCIREFARHFGKPPDQLGAEHIRQYQLFRVKEREVSLPSYIQALARAAKTFATAASAALGPEPHPVPSAKPSRADAGSRRRIVVPPIALTCYRPRPPSPREVILKKLPFKPHRRRPAQFNGILSEALTPTDPTPSECSGVSAPDRILFIIGTSKELPEAAFQPVAEADPPGALSCAQRALIERKTTIANRIKSRAPRQNSLSQSEYANSRLRGPRVF